MYINFRNSNSSSNNNNNSSIVVVSWPRSGEEQVAHPLADEVAVVRSGQVVRVVAVQTLDGAEVSYARDAHCLQ